MNLTCIDIGNTNIVIGSYKDGNLKTSIRIQTDSRQINKKINFENLGYVAISSVVPEIEEIMKNKINLPCFTVSHTNSNVILDVDSPSEVGNDRICNMKVAIKNKLYPSIIVDFGSATTYDVINNKGNFIGGAIAPGIDVSAKNLFKKAAQLDTVNFKVPKYVIGKNTVTNLQSGIMYGGIDSINGMIRRIKEEVDYDINHIILTGGFSSLLSKKITTPHTVEPDLTLQGIKYIWEENQ